MNEVCMKRQNDRPSNSTVNYEAQYSTQTYTNYGYLSQKQALWDNNSTKIISICEK